MERRRRKKALNTGKGEKRNLVMLAKDKMGVRWRFG